MQVMYSFNLFLQSSCVLYIHDTSKRLIEEELSQPKLASRADARVGQRQILTSSLEFVPVPVEGGRCQPHGLEISIAENVLLIRGLPG